MLKLLVHFCIKKYSTRGTLEKIDDGVIRVNATDFFQRPKVASKNSITQQSAQIF